MDRPNLLPLFAYGDYGPVLVMEGSIMLPSGTRKGADATLRWAGRNQRLSIAQSLRDTTADFWSANERWFWQRLEEAMRAEGYQGAPLADLRKLPDQVAVIHFACNELIPRIRKLSGQPASDESRLPDPTDSRTVCARSLSALSHVPDSCRTVAAFWSSMPELGWAIIDQQAYELVPRERSSWLARAGYARGHIKTPTDTYLLRPLNSTPVDLARRFEECATQSIRAHSKCCWPLAVRAHEELSRALGDKAGLLYPSRPADQGKVSLYDSPTWKVFRQGSQWYLGLAIGPYAMEDNGRMVYAMDPTVLLMPLFGDLGLASASVETVGYQHPFVRPGGRDICMGDYGMRESLLPRRHSGGPAERMLSYVMDVRQTMLAGYHQGNPLRPYRHLSEMGNRIIAREVAEQRKLPIYPYYRR